MSFREFVGEQFEPPRTSPDVVNAASIRHWCHAIGDDNPLYEEFAPPTMLQAWTMGEPDFFAEDATRRPAVLRALDEAGFTAVIATNCEQTYERYLRIGDRVSVASVIESVSDEKQTALGPGHFVTWRYTFTDQNGGVVGTQTFRVLKYRPQPRRPQRPRPTVGKDNEFFWEGVKQGNLLVQRCSSCGRVRHPPRPMCPSCNSLVWEAVPSSGRGEVHCFIVPRHPKLPAFGDEYIVALIDMEEGFRLLSNLTGVQAADAKVGMPVEVVFEKVDEELVLPLFRPR